MLDGNLFVVPLNVFTTVSGQTRGELHGPHPQPGPSLLTPYSQQCDAGGQPAQGACGHL